MRSIEDSTDSSDTLAIVAEENAETHPRPPLEPELGALTLWPESEKVFGHGYEVWSLLHSYDAEDSILLPSSLLWQLLMMGKC